MDGVLVVLNELGALVAALREENAKLIRQVEVLTVELKKTAQQ